MRASACLSSASTPDAHACVDAASSDSAPRTASAHTWPAPPHVATISCSEAANAASARPKRTDALTHAPRVSAPTSAATPRSSACTAGRAPSAHRHTSRVACRQRCRQPWIISSSRPHMPPHWSSCTPCQPPGRACAARVTSSPSASSATATSRSRAVRAAAQPSAITAAAASAAAAQEARPGLAVVEEEVGAAAAEKAAEAAAMDGAVGAVAEAAVAVDGRAPPPTLADAKTDGAAVAGDGGAAAREDGGAAAHEEADAAAREGSGRVEVLFYEVATGGCCDLLNGRGPIVLRSDENDQVHARGAKAAVVRTGEELRSVLRAALAMRSTVETEANPISSRSHAICSLRFLASGRTLRLVDLAGSERNYETHHSAAAAHSEPCPPKRTSRGSRLPLQHALLGSRLTFRCGGGSLCISWQAFALPLRLPPVAFSTWPYLQPMARLSRPHPCVARGSDVAHLPARVGRHQQGPHGAQGLLPRRRAPARRRRRRHSRGRCQRRRQGRRQRRRQGWQGRAGRAHPVPLVDADARAARLLRRPRAPHRPRRGRRARGRVGAAHVQHARPRDADGAAPGLALGRSERADELWRGALVRRREAQRPFEPPGLRTARARVKPAGRLETTRTPYNPVREAARRKPAGRATAGRSR
mmetsp:Transcript_34756/g.95944  ORF Transcript_34756/g.95944 Transcript_34756/m.95944 type:complete len:646 (+) Transcript_34756:381-2318(+)